MWLLSFIPDSIIYGFVTTIFYAGVVCSLLGFIFNFGFLAPYRMIVQVVGILLLVAGVYFKGGYEVEIKWRARVAEVEKKVAIAEQKAKDATGKIQIKVVEKIKIVKQNVEKTKVVIQKEKEVINRECKLNDTAIQIYNQSVTNTVGEVTPNAK